MRHIRGVSRALYHDRWPLFLIAGVLCFVGFGVFVLEHYPPGTCREIRVNLRVPFKQTEGFEYRATLPPEILGSGIASDNSGRGLSPLTLWEDNRRLDHGHAFRSEIQRTGKGAFLHWGDIIYFSSSDNADPTASGRTYQVRRVTGLPLSAYMAILVVGFALTLLFLMVLHRLMRHKRWASCLIQVSTLVVMLVVVEMTAWVLTEHKLTEYGPLVRNLYRKAFSAQWSPVNMPHEPGLKLNYVPHHYLNYTLNPDIAYCGIYQFNDRYRIRRRESIARHTEEKWRILIVGGSTTFAEGIPREQDTWPYVLESLIRTRCDPGCDVINGGIGGYTALENFIHYIVLLRDLEPDVVLLCTGLNDVHPRLFDEIRTDYSNYRLPWRSTVQHLWRPNRLLEFSFSYRYYFLNKVVLGTLYEGIGSQVSRKGPPPSAWPAALARNSERTYRNHLDDFIRLLTAKGIRVAILPQFFVPQKDSYKAFAAAVDAHNRVNAELAKEHGLPFAAELISPQVFHAGDLSDSCHFNEQGCRKMGAVVFAFLKQHELLRTCSQH